MASISPQARLQPSAPISLVVTLNRLAATMLSAQVALSALISLKRISDILSIGSMTLFSTAPVSCCGMKRAFSLAGECPYLDPA